MTISLQKEIERKIMREKAQTAAESFTVIEPSDIGEALKNLNSDEKSTHTPTMSDIDMRTRLNYTEISAVLAIDTLVGFNFLPTETLAITKQKKRLSVSLGGQGRKEIVQIATGERNNEIGGVWPWSKKRKNEIQQQQQSIQ